MHHQQQQLESSELSAQNEKKKTVCTTSTASATEPRPSLAKRAYSQPARRTVDPDAVSTDLPTIVTTPPPKLDSLDPNDLSALLSMETQERSDAQMEVKDTPPPRPSRLTFELPVTPPRSRSPAAPAYPRPGPMRRSRSSEVDERRHRQRLQSPDRKNAQSKRHQRHRRWSLLTGSDNASDSEPENEMVVGSRVNLFKRPLPTIGTVRYIGPVESEIGEWVGVELDHRVGNSDGCIRGKRYFSTDPQRGIFLKRNDLELE
ncbi:hypothetical protein DM01DRAFT_314812 [Hesseltinella vesiculosa]|uniref:CAP-Gly domain-containing protein n=1 Tax=Hesseltinella vesiculosa TaxID=101127 RepID=A0A1X2GUV5_9FUNG|nr:hypothetical protein DM01DRAFT_314812 [Hesseltinella vesiculosa]